MCECVRSERMSIWVMYECVFAQAIYVLENSLLLAEASNVCGMGMNVNVNIDEYG